MEGTDNQTMDILRYMEEVGSITPVDAIREFGCLRLSARIWDLRNKFGYIIRKEIEEGVNRFGKKIRYARYYLEGRA